MIYLIHGANQVDSRRFLIRFKSNYQDVQNIPGKNLSSSLLQEKLGQASHHLFGGKSAFLIENFSGDWGIFPKRLPEGLDIILWSEEKIEMGDSRVKSFLFDQQRKATAFKLADAILFKNEKEAQVLAWQLLVSKEPPEKIVGAALRGLLLAFCAKETLRGVSIPPFVRKKAEEQAKFWSRQNLKRAILELLRAEIALKEGRTASLVFAHLIHRVVSL